MGVIALYYRLLSAFFLFESGVKTGICDAVMRKNKIGKVDFGFVSLDFLIVSLHFQKRNGGFYEMNGGDFILLNGIIMQ